MRQAALRRRSKRRRNMLRSLQAAIQATPAQGELAMVFCRDSLLPQMDKVRAAADALEGIVDRARWPFPTYVDLLFSEG